MISGVEIFFFVLGTFELLKYNVTISTCVPRSINSYKNYGNKVLYYDEIAKHISEYYIIIIVAKWDTIKNYNFNCIKTN